MSKYIQVDVVKYCYIVNIRKIGKQYKVNVTFNRLQIEKIL